VVPERGVAPALQRETAILDCGLHSVNVTWLSMTGETTAPAVTEAWRLR
jgi:hypothetical protein